MYAVYRGEKERQRESPDTDSRKYIGEFRKTKRNIFSDIKNTDSIERRSGENREELSAARKSGRALFKDISVFEIPEIERERESSGKARLEDIEFHFRKLREQVQRVYI